MELKLCMKCMKEVRDEGKPCPHCGFDAVRQAALPHQLPYGSVLNGKYMTGAVLGEGGFGITYIGYDLNLGIRVAVKEFYPYGFVGREATQSLSVRSFSGEASEMFAKGRERLLKEARSLAQFMKLPGIVGARDFFMENNTAYIVMEYIEGPSLKEYARSLGGTIGTGELLEMMRPVIQSLIEVHGRGVIHRDISPDNILIDTEGKAWLIDFGAMRDVSPEGERTLSVTLKKGYSPEEQYRTHGEQGPWTDVYSMCATLYAMMTGIKPDEPFDRLENETLKRPRIFGVRLSEQQEKTLMKGLAIKRKDRLQSMEEVFNGLCSAEAQPEADDAKKEAPEEKTEVVPSGRETPKEKAETGKTAEAKDSQQEEKKEEKKEKEEAAARSAFKEKEKKEAALQDEIVFAEKKKRVYLLFAAILVLCAVLITIPVYRNYAQKSNDLHIERSVFYHGRSSTTPYQIGEEVLTTLKDSLPYGCSDVSFSVNGRRVTEYRISATNLTDSSAIGYDAEDERVTVHYKHNGYSYETPVRLAVVRPEVKANVGFIDTNDRITVDYANDDFFTVRNGDYLERSVRKASGEMLLTLKDQTGQSVASAGIPTGEQSLARAFEQYWIDRNGLQGYGKESRGLAQGLLEIWIEHMGEDATERQARLERYVTSHVTGRSGWHFSHLYVRADEVPNVETALEKVLQDIEKSEAKEWNPRVMLPRATAIGASSVTRTFSNGEVYHLLVYLMRFR